MSIDTTRIRLYGRVDGYLDTDSETQVPLTFSISDIKDISKRKGTFSKSIKIPGTKNNNILLNNYFDVNIVSGAFNINKIVNCAIIQDGITILDNAILQLVSVDMSQQSIPQGKIEYTVLIKDTASDFFTNINNKFLSDINLQGLNHIYNANAVISSFNNTVNDGYKYVMPFNSPNLDILGADAVFDLIEFSPGIYVKTYFDKIFASASYTYNWPDALTKYRFDKLIIPYNGDVIKVDKEDSSYYTATANRTITATYSATRGTKKMNNFNGQYSGSGGARPLDEKIGFISTTNFQTIIPNNEVIDPNNNYDPTTGIYTTPDLPSNQNDVKVEYTIEYETVVVNNSGNIAHHIGFYNPEFPNEVFPIFDGYTRIPSSQGRQIKPTIRLMNSNTIAFSDILNNGIPTYISSGATFSTGKTILKSGTMSFSRTIEGLVPNNQIYISTGINFTESVLSFPYFSALYNFYSVSNPTLGFADYFSTPVLTNVFIQTIIKKVDIKFTSMIDGAVSFNTQLKMNKFIPVKIKQSDFVKGILTMFNLYVEVDKTNPTIINIIGRDDYYDSGVIKDWSEKLVKDQTQEVKFIPEITNKKLLITYKPDKDWANERYTAATNEIYGQVEYTFDNEFVKDVSRTELLFSPTPVANTEFGAICPIWNGQAPKTNIRILYDGGEYTCGQYTIVNYRDPNGVTGSFINASTFPLITHWDKPENPTFDLNFLPPDYYYRTDNWGSNTNNNLFNSFWRRTINQINNGKILTAYFHLNSYDIQKLRLNDKIRIDNSWWVINSVKDYDANSKKPTKVELISVDDSIEIPFVERQTFRINPGNPALQVLNDLEASKARYKNTIITTGHIDVVGRDNYVGAGVAGKVIGNNNNVYSQTTLIYGDSNSTNSTKSIILGDNNIVENNVENAMVVGDFINATQSNTLYASNIIIPEGGNINNISITNIVGLWEADTVNTGVIEAITGYNTLVGGSAGTSVDNATTDSIAWGNNVEISGAYSAAFGLDTIAGDNAIVAGDGCNATGAYSAAFGYFTTATGSGSMAGGSGCQATGQQSFSYGLTNISSGNWSVSFGQDNSANGEESISMGAQCISSNVGSVTIGRNAVASGEVAVAIGQDLQATGEASFVVNSLNSSIGDFSISGGHENTANSIGETVIGHYSESIAGSSTSIDPDDTIFRVGIGQSTVARLDGFRVYKNGAIKLNPVTNASITTPLNGMVIFNSSTNTMNNYNGSSWVNTDGSPIVKKYIAIIDCNTNSATILFNTLGGTPTISCGVVGVTTFTTTININLSSVFTSNKTFVSYTPAVLSGIIDSYGGRVKNTDTSNVDISLQALNGTDYTSNLGVHVEITVYP
jgi:hypothetical protein